MPSVTLGAAMTRTPAKPVHLRPSGERRRASQSSPRAAERGAGSPLPRREATVSACQQLRELIVTGRLAPGAPLIETELSERLGVSRTPVRAALLQLQQEGLVGASRAGSMTRAVVAPLTAEDMREVFLMTGALEAAAARIVAGLPEPERQALADEMAQLSAAVHVAVASVPPDVAAALEAHARFHRSYSKAGAGPRLLTELEVLQPQADRYERIYASAVVHAFADATREHMAIVDAVRSGDGDAAEQAVHRHWRASAGRYRQVVTILGERGNW
jgi:DNA-binding GntR family transcriptional regulator